MTFTVVYRPSCENDLAGCWIAAPDRAAVAAAADTIDPILHDDPYRFSESRGGQSRVMIVPPLGVAFDVSDEDCLVSVWAAWRID
jgi:hypothetical protein